MKKTKKSLFIIIVSLAMALGTFSALYSMNVIAQEEPEVFFTISLKAPLGYKVREQVGALLAEELPKIGIGVELEYHDFATLLDQVDLAGSTGATASEGGVDIFLMGMSPDSTDPAGLTSWFHSEYVRPEGNNGWRYFDPELDRLLEEGENLIEQSEREPIYYRVLEKVKDKAFVVELFYPTFYASKDVNVENCDLWYDPGYGTWEIRSWTLADKTEADDTTVIYALSTDIRNIIEPLSELTYDRQVHNVMFDALIQHEWTLLDPQYDGPMPNLAESWDISDDGLTFTFHLREDVMWHDGVPFTSADVKFTFDAIIDPDTAAADAVYWRENVESITAPDEYTVVVKLKRVFPAVWELIFRRCIMPEHILKDIESSEWLTSSYNTGEDILPGTGPYKLVQWRRDEYFEFEAYDDYHLGRPFVDKFFIQIIPDASVGIAALEAGEVQLLPTSYFLDTEYDRLNDNPNIVVQTAVPLWAQQLHINCEHPILQNEWVRNAISHAIPREHIVEDLAGGWAQPATQFVTPARTWAYNPNLEMTPYDLDQAKAYMEKAGFNYEWLETSEDPTTGTMGFIVPAAGGLIVGLIAGIALMYVMRQQ
jgi:ABC-type transport system substrate-binding protein